MGRHRTVCTKCSTEMRVEKNGVLVIDMADFGPAEAWLADLYKCADCGVEVVPGDSFAAEAVWVHYDKSDEMEPVVMLAKRIKAAPRVVLSYQYVTAKAQYGKKHDDWHCDFCCRTLPHEIEHANAPDMPGLVLSRVCLGCRTRWSGTD